MPDAFQTQTLVTVNPYAYMSALSRKETYDLLAAAFALALIGTLLVQRALVARTVSAMLRSHKGTSIRSDMREWK